MLFRLHLLILLGRSHLIVILMGVIKGGMGVNVDGCYCLGFGCNVASTCRLLISGSGGA